MRNIIHKLISLFFILVAVACENRGTSDFNLKIESMSKRIITDSSNFNYTVGVSIDCKAYRPESKLEVEFIGLLEGYHLSSDSLKNIQITQGMQEAVVKLHGDKIIADNIDSAKAVFKIDGVALDSSYVHFIKTESQRKYSVPHAKYGSYATIASLNFGDLNIRKLYTGGQSYFDMSHNLAHISRDKSKIEFKVEQASASLNDKCYFKCWIDWNNDGDFSDSTECVVDSIWKANGAGLVSTVITPPSSAAEISRARIALYDIVDKDLFKNADGPIHSGEVIDLSYKIVDTIETIPALQIPNNYPTPSVGYISYATMSGYEIGDLECKYKDQNYYEGWGDSTHLITNLSRGKNKFNISLRQGKSCDNDRYTIAIWADFDGDYTFDDDQEELYRGIWLADGQADIEGYFEIPDSALEKGRLRMGIYYSDGSTDFDNGEGHIDSGDLIDITYVIK